MIDPHAVRENIKVLEASIRNAAERSGRQRENILLVAVTKTVPPDAIQVAVDAGIRIFGENRIQEAADKIPKLGSDLSWHMVGHLQTNKAKIGVKLFDTIHSVDSVKLARIIDRCALEAGKVQRCLVEIKLSAEESKFGMQAADVRNFFEEAANLSNISISGLMTVPPYDPDPEKSRQYFVRLRELAQEISAWGLQGIAMKELSMG